MVSPPPHVCTVVPMDAVACSQTCVAGRTEALTVLNMKILGTSALYLCRLDGSSIPYPSLSKYLNVLFMSLYTISPSTELATHTVMDFSPSCNILDKHSRNQGSQGCSCRELFCQATAKCNA